MLLGLACRAGSAPGPLAPGDHDVRVEVDGETRSYWLHLPEPVAWGEPVPLLLAFHGGGGSAAGFRAYAGIDAVADREGFAVAYPDGSGGLGRRLLTWNAGRCCGRAEREDVDDVHFARVVVDDVAARIAIDRARVYATGHSNGAMMSYRLAAEAPDLVAAIAPVGGAMILADFRGEQAVPVLHVHSVDDPRALYEGGLGPPFPMTKRRVFHNPVEQELRRWIDLAGCPAEPSVVERREDGGHGATHLRWAPCRGGVVVELWKLSGAGHGWPGGDAALPERLVGPDTRVISASEEGWRFLSRFRKP